MREFRPRMQTERKFIAPHFVQEVLEMVGSARCADRTLGSAASLPTSSPHSIWKNSKRLSEE